MDELDSGFGRLSTSAAEWQPGGSQQRGDQSDLKASAVKEFVPGQGWSSSAAAVPRVEPNYEPAHQSALDGATNQDIYLNQGPSSTTTGPPASPMPSFRSLDAMAIPNDLWRHFHGLSLESTRQMEATDPRHKAIPMPFTNGFCLDDMGEGNTTAGLRSTFFGYPSSTFQVTNTEDGNLYCLRRFESCRCVSPKIAAMVTERWTSSAVVVEHPAVAPLYRCFLQQRAVFFLHQFVPGARTLQERLAGPLAEPAIWSCVCQLLSALRAVHGAGLAVRAMQLQHVLTTSDSVGSRLRVRLGSVGIVDALEFETRRNVIDLQKKDVRDLGCLILSMGTGTEVTMKTLDPARLRQCESTMSASYSRDLVGLALTLVKSAPDPPTVGEISKAVSFRLLDEQNLSHQALDRTEHAVATEYDAGRYLRLLLKLGFINERPEFGQDRRWSESGECYVLKLFRDYGGYFFVKQQSTSSNEFQSFTKQMRWAIQ